MIDSQRINRFLDHYQIDDPDLLSAWLGQSSIIQAERDQVLLQTGAEQTHLFVILSGLIRYYYTSPNGKEWNRVFFREQQIIGSLSALLTQSPSRFTIAALEASELIATPIDSFIKLGDQFPQITRLQIQVTEEMFLRNELREGILLTGNTEERYQWLIGNEPWLLERVPQYQLASYLGMDAVSFSRVKSKLSN
ncbi:Crp/Fnr family transcriptional regulator [Maricurvus nonylphenolicus]|uniref:Crp/Fnr family transcriptional regulator n=1 Tax=Maricurvus nonylphenolicus TaxID=1008307 RepID=UPI0036F3A318